MGLRMPVRIGNGKQIARPIQMWKENGNERVVPKGHFAVYVGESVERKKKYAVPISYLKHPSFKMLLSQAEEEFGFHHQMGALTIPCTEQVLLNLIW